jgi:GTP pyrophosphokinase
MSETESPQPSNPSAPVLPNGGYPMHSFEQLKELFYTYIKNPEDRKMVEDAYHLADLKHKGVLRKSGEPYIHHPIEVAYILASSKAGRRRWPPGCLHDTVEDTDLTIEDIRKQFGDDVAMIVDSLTKIQRMKLSHRTEQDFEAEDHRKIFLGHGQDVRVILVKLADRLHNMRTLEALKPDRQKAFAKETLDVFTPIAHRLGIYTIQANSRISPSNILNPPNTTRFSTSSIKKRRTAKSP